MDRDILELGLLCIEVFLGYGQGYSRAMARNILGIGLGTFWNNAKFTRDPNMS